MNKYQDGFRNEILNTMFSLAGKIWLKITGGYTALFAISLLLTIIMVMLAGISSLGSAITNLTDYRSVFETYNNTMLSMANSTSMVIVLSFLYAILLLLGSWFVFFSFKIAENQILGKKLFFGDVLSKSLSKKVLFKMLIRKQILKMAYN